MSFADGVSVRRFSLRCNADQTGSREAIHDVGRFRFIPLDMERIRWTLFSLRLRQRTKKSVKPMCTGHLFQTRRTKSAHKRRSTRTRAGLPMLKVVSLVWRLQLRIRWPLSSAARPVNIGQGIHVLGFGRQALFRESLRGQVQSSTEASSVCACVRGGPPVSALTSRG